MRCEATRERATASSHAPRRPRLQHHLPPAAALRQRTPPPRPLATHHRRPRRATLLSDFLDHLEHQRGNSPRSRNARLAAIHSFYRHVALSDPRHLLHCQRIQAIPSKRHHHNNIEYLTEHETEALLASPDPATWLGRRDRALLLVAIQTGLRVSELISLQRQHVTLGNGAHVRCYGKGRKLRATPLRRDVARILQAWLRERPPAPDTPVFPNHRGGHLSSDAVERLVTKHATAAHTRCPSLTHKHVTPHTLRHSAAMALLQRGVDRTVIALWLGHESPETEVDPGFRTGALGGKR